MIKLAVVSYENAAPPAPIAALFGAERKTIGRGAENFLVLPDPHNAVALTQAAIWSDGANHTLANLGDTGAVLVNGRALDAGAEAAIEPRDQIRIGPYLLQVEHASAQNGADVEALKAAFLRGAGIAADAHTAEWTPETMELIGRLMATSLQGTIDLLALRSLVKNEVHADVTMVVVRNNNPLKFFPDSQTVLTQMLRKKMPGFMEPLESVEDAVHDLRAHQMGMVAGTRASMDTMMARLKPGHFESALAPRGLLDTLVPSRRPAALWQSYAKQYGALTGEAKDRFAGEFWDAFLAAYETEVERFDDEHRHG